MIAQLEGSGQPFRRRQRRCPSMSQNNMVTWVARRVLRAIFAIAFVFVSPFAAAQTLLIRQVNVVPMTASGELQRNVDVTIREGRIVSIEAAKPDAEKNVATVDGRGQWLIPALADMHVHIENDRLLRLYLKDPHLKAKAVKTADALLPYVANGVLQVAALTAMPETIAQRDDVEAGRVLGPHIALAAMIDGSPPAWPVGMTRVAATPSDGRQAVRDVHAEGYEFVKTYERLDVDTFLAIVDEARKLGMKVIGHLPQDRKGLTEKFFVPGFNMIAHAEEIAQQASPPAVDLIPRYAEWAKRNDTWLTSTLSLDTRIVEMLTAPETLRQRPELLYLHPTLQQITIDNNPYVKDASPDFIEHVRHTVAFNRKLIPQFAAAGIPIVAGTDALVPGVAPGFSLHDELAALVEAGLTPRQALEAATRRPAEFLGTIEDRGVIAPGKRADLVMLDANPLQDITNTRRIAGVIVKGVFYSRTELNARMQSLQRANAVSR